MNDAVAQRSKWASYPAYKPSGVEWLGNVPEHWAVKRLKYTASINDEALPETTDPDYEFHYVDIGNVDGAKGIVSTETYSFENAPSRARRVVRDGDTIVSTVRTYLRAIAAIREPEDDLIVSTGFAVVRPRGIDPDYLSYALRSPFFVETVVSRSTGVSYPAINAPEIGTIPIPIPAAEEQRAIAAFLDRRTQRIDALIEKKERQIELLQEKRTALISHAVTKGLDPNVKMKDSGIEWLGEIPEHWEIAALRRIGEFSASGIDKKSEDGQPHVRMVNYTDVYGNRDSTITPTRQLMRTTAPAEKVSIHHLRKGDLLFTPSSETADEIGISAVVTDDMPDTVYSYHLIRFRPHIALHLGFRKYFCNHPGVWHQFTMASKGTTRQILTRENFKTALVAIPPYDEQRAIAAFLDRETARIDALIEKIRKSIDLLREYRTALISAAVTGKIDVRGEVKAVQPRRKAPPAFRRAVLAAEIADRLHDDPTFGRVKFQKILYLCEYHLGMDLGGNYRRQAAGPLDSRMLRSVEGQMERQKWYAAQSDARRTTYVPLENAGGHRKYFDNYWSDYREGLDSLIALLRPLDTERCEIVATLFAAWNDLIIVGKPFDDDDILREVRGKWHESKERFDERRLRRALQWMRDKGLVPQGRGKATTIKPGERLNENSHE